MVNTHFEDVPDRFYLTMQHIVHAFQGWRYATAFSLLVWCLNIHTYKHTTPLLVRVLFRREMVTLWRYSHFGMNPRRRGKHLTVENDGVSAS